MVAKSLSAENPQEKKISAGKLFFQKLKKSVEDNKSLLIESTLAGHYLQKFLKNLKGENYEIIIGFGHNRTTFARNCDSIARNINLIARSQTIFARS